MGLLLEALSWIESGRREEEWLLSLILWNPSSAHFRIKVPVLLGLDLGEKRVGLARSDESGMIAEPLETLHYKTKEHLFQQLKRHCKGLQPQKIVVGLPQTLRGGMGPSAQRILDLVDWLKERLPAEWVLWDERFSTWEAERVLLEADLSRSKRRGIRDRLAAQRILQSYLDATRHAPSN